MRNRYGIIAIALLLADARLAVAAPDSCQTLLPRSLREQVETQYPRYRLVRQADYTKETIEAERTDRGGNTCIGASSGDFDGDGERDYGILITSSNSLILLAARYLKGNKWIVDKLWDLEGANISHMYVSTLAPGKYEMTLAGPSERQTEPDELTAYESKHNGIGAGHIESSCKGFFFNEKRWVYVWISD